MGDFQVIEIILFALVAGFLILRLRNVLGRRDGHQGPVHDPFRAPPPRDRTDDTVIRLPDRGDRSGEPAEPAVAGRGSDGPLAEGVVQIKRADPSFDLDEFLSGARIAFEMILTAYASGDRAALKPLLSQEVFNNFEHSMREREDSGEKIDISLVGITSAEPVEVYMAGRTAHVTVKVVSEQMTVTRDDQGNVVDRDTKADIVDFWTFARDTRSRDPNWTLVATGSPE